MHTEPKMTDTARPWPDRAVIDALAPHVLDARLGRMQQALAHRLESIALGVEDLHHSHNGHACLRTAEGLGVQDAVAVELRNPYPLETPDEPLNRKITMAAHRWIDLHRVPTSDALVDWARSRNMAVFGAGPRGEATLDTLPADRPLMVLFGNEREGLRPETLSACDGVFRIPMYGFTESFNVSVSVGMTLAALTSRVRARLTAEGRTGDLSPERRDALLARWLLADVRGAEAIVRRKLGSG